MRSDLEREEEAYEESRHLAGDGCFQAQAQLSSISGVDQPEIGPCRWDSDPPATWFLIKSRTREDVGGVVVWCLECGTEH